MVMDLHSPRTGLTPRNLREFKLVVVGPRKVGKSALVVRFLTRRFINEYLENADMTCNGVVAVDGETLRVNIQDTSEKGMRLSSMDHHFRWADAIMLVYSVTDPDSFRQLRDTAGKIVEKMNEIDEKEMGRVPPLVLVGNKCDLDFATRVTRQEGLQLAEQLHCEFYETSAREGWSKFIARTRSYPKVTKTGTTNSPPFTTSVIGIGLAAKTALAISYDSGRRPSKVTRSHSRSNSSFGVKGEINGNCIMPTVNVSKAPKSDSGTPSPSEDDSDDCKVSPVHRLALPKGKKSRFGQNSLIGRLSPRLSRKIYKTEKVAAAPKRSKSVKTNNRSLMNGLSSTLFTAGTPISHEFSANLAENGHHLSSSSTSSSASATGSTESLTSCEVDSDGRDSMSPSLNFGDRLSPNTASVVKEKWDNSDCENCVGRSASPGVWTMRAHDFCLSEPFLHLCRDGKSIRQRQRPRSPSHLLRSGFKRIKSLKTDGHHLQVNHSIRALPN